MLSFQNFKFKYWGHDSVVLHEHELRKSLDQFSFLRANRKLRESFFADLNELMKNVQTTLISSIIKKTPLLKKYPDPWSPYDIALHFCLERLLEVLIGFGQAGKKTHVIFESRGKREDRELELEFRKITSGQSTWGYRKKDFSHVDLEIVFQSKSANSTGLQIADLTARPIALNTLKPDQENRAYQIFRDKIRYEKAFP